MEMLKHWEKIVSEKVSQNPMLLIAIKDNQLSEFIFNEGVTHGREHIEAQLKEAEKVIDFYGDEENYKAQDYKGMHNLPPISGDYIPLSDNGKKAREYKTRFNNEG